MVIRPKLLIVALYIEINFYSFVHLKVLIGKISVEERVKPIFGALVMIVGLMERRC